MADNNFDKLQRKSKGINQLMSKMTVLIGTEAVNFSKKRFREQSWVDHGSDPWAKRKPGAARNKGRGLLVDSGKLRNSIRITKRGKDFVSVGSSVVYAEIHNKGGVINIPVTDRMRKWGWAMFAKTKDSKYKGLALTKKTSLRVNMPQRKFIGNSAVLRQITKRMMVARFKVILNN